jgi:type I restriction enzyme S subunit
LNIETDIKGGLLKNYHLEDLRKATITYIPNEEQASLVLEIESRLSVCDKIEESIEQSLKLSEALRQSILKKAFEGKLVPQNPNDEPATVLLERIRQEREQSDKAKIKQPKIKKSGSRKSKTEKVL